MTARRRVTSSIIESDVPLPSLDDREIQWIRRHAQARGKALLNVAGRIDKQNVRAPERVRSGFGVYAITKTETAEALVAEAQRRRPGVPVARLFVDGLALAIKQWPEPTKPKRAAKGGEEVALSIRAAIDAAKVQP